MRITARKLTWRVNWMNLQNHVHKEKKKINILNTIHPTYMCKLDQINPGTFQLQKPLLTTSSQKMI